MNNNFLKVIIALIFPICFWACDPNSLYWSLPKVSQVATKVISCDNFSSCNAQYIYWSGTAYRNTSWTISPNGYKGNCFISNDPNISGVGAFGGTVIFSHEFKNRGVMRFWITNYEVPEVHGNATWYSNNVVSEAEINGILWQQYEAGPFEKGIYSLKIEWPQHGPSLVYKLDEIEFYEEKN